MPRVDASFQPPVWKGLQEARGMVVGHLRHFDHFDNPKMILPISFEIDTGGDRTLLLDWSFVNAIITFGTGRGYPPSAKAYEWAINWLDSGQQLFEVVGENEAIETLAGKVEKPYRMPRGFLQLCNATKNQLSKGCADVGPIYATFSKRFRKHGRPYSYSILGRSALNRIHQLLWEPSRNSVVLNVTDHCPHCETSAHKEKSLRRRILEMARRMLDRYESA